MTIGGNGLRHRRPALVLVAAVAVVIVSVAVHAGQFLGAMRDPRTQDLRRWLSGDAEARRALVTSGRAPCPEAPFLLPTDGYIGLLYADKRPPYSASQPHQGIDIFSRAAPGESPVYAAFDGYLTRKADWRSAVIVRVPDDPLAPGRQIWLYYAHMANADGSESYIEAAFPPGTREKPVARGTLLGHTGNYRGASGRRVAVHLHFSIVQDDGRGAFANELEFANSIDPSPYLGMSVNVACAPAVPACTGQPGCP